jgi:DNA-binding MarR family transcriptional regulator/GNAT superfamily N-acetyltransferase
MVRSRHATADAAMPRSVSHDRITAVRQFNRFYTQRIGVLQDSYLQSPFSLSEARVLFEICRRERPSASEIARALGLDPGYLSRILRSFSKRGLITRRTSSADRRQTLLSPTARGRSAMARLDARSQADVGDMLQSLGDPEQRRLVAAMSEIEELVGIRLGPKVPFILRPPVPGDMGWVVSRHGAVYCGEHGWSDRIESMTAEIVAAFMRNYDPQRERCWIAEREGETVGVVFLVKRSAQVAQLRLLLVEAKARGLGIGARLVAESERFARQAGYRKIMLWTHTVLTAARHVYKQAGYRLIESEPHDEFGKTLTGETWELTL